jgi:hypothetical protein
MSSDVRISVLIVAADTCMPISRNNATKPAAMLATEPVDKQNISGLKALDIGMCFVSGYA